MSRQEKVFLATLANDTQRYDDLIELMKEVVHMKEGLNREEANMFSLGYKHKISGCRNAWRTLSILEPRQNDEGFNTEEAVASFRLKVENEMDNICKEVIQLIDESILPNVEGAESKAFFLKMKADYYRYLSEFAQDDEFDRVVKEALAAYEQASKIAEELPEAHPVTLGIALNFSVFYFEALGDQTKACDLAKSALETPEEKVNELPEEQAKESKQLLELLKDNLDLWTNGAETASNDQDED